MGPSHLSAAVLPLAVLLSACASPEPDAPAATTDSTPILYFANWDGEIGPTTLADFERETGIRVVVESLVDNVTLQTKLLAGGSGSDVVVPGSNFIGPLIDAGALQPLDRRQLPNWRHLDPQILISLDRIDPGNRHGVPYVWGTQAFAYNVAAVRAALGAEPPPSWRLLFDPDYTRKLADCGIAWQDSAGSIMVDLALLALGADPAGESLTDLAAAERTLRAVRGDVRYLDNSGRFQGDLASGAICIATGASGELAQARDLARETGQGIDIRYVIPEEGALTWIDLLVIPADAPHPAAAHRFIDFLLRPEVIAAVTNASRYANANRAALPLIHPSVRSDPAIYPDEASRARLKLVPAESAAYARERTRMWTRVRTARD